MAFTDVGIRIVILGVGEARRATNQVQNDLNGLNKTIKDVSGSSTKMGDALVKTGESMQRLGRTLTLTVTTPLLLLEGALFSAGISFEDSFVGVGKTVDGVSIGFKELLADNRNYQRQAEKYRRTYHAETGEWLSMAEALGYVGRSLSQAEKDAIFADERFGQLTETGAEIRSSFRDMALEIPISVNELAKIGEIAGQLGVPADQIVGFTETIAKLGVTTDLTTEAAAFGIARFANIFGVKSEDLSSFASNFGNAIVALGNNAAATEPEILELARQMAGAGQLAGLTEQQVLGIAASMAEVGIRAEAGGSSFSRIMYELLEAVGQGGEELDIFAKAAGMSAEEFAATWGEDPVKAITTLLPRLAELQESGEITQDELAKIGLSGIRVKQVISLLGPNMEILTENIELANKAWAEQIALDEEAAKRFVTIASLIQLLKNGFTDLGIELFDLYRDDIENLINGFRDLIKSFKELSPEQKRQIVLLGAIAAAVGPVLLVFGTLTQQAGVTLNALAGFPKFIYRTLIPAIAAMLPVLIPLAAIFGGIYYIWSRNIGNIQTLIKSLADDFQLVFGNSITGTIKDIAKQVISGDFVGAFESIKTLVTNLGQFLSSPWVTMRIKQWGRDALAEFVGPEDIARVTENINSFIDSIRALIDRIAEPLKIGFDGLKAGIQGFIDEVSTADAQGAAETIGIIAGALLVLASDLAGGVLLFIGLLLPKLGAAFRHFVNAVADLGEGDIAGTLSNLGKGLGELGLGLSDTIGTTIQAIADALSDLTSFEPETIDALGTALLLFGIKAFVIPVAATAIAGLAAALTTLYMAAAPALLAFVLLDGAISAFKNNTFGLKDDVNELGTAIKEGDIAGALDAVSDIVTKFPIATLANIAQKAADAIGLNVDVEGGLQAWETTFNSIEEIVRWFVGQIGQAVKDIFAIFFGGGGRDAPDINLQATFDQIPTAVSDALSGFGDTIKTSLVDPIIEKVKEVVSWLADPNHEGGLVWGIKSIIQGIIDNVGDIEGALQTHLVEPFKRKIQEIIDSLGPIKNLLEYLGINTTIYTPTVEEGSSPPPGYGAGGPPPDHSQYGGRIPGKRPRLVGETGLELFWPDTAGFVVSNPAFKRIMSEILSPMSVGGPTTYNQQQYNYAPAFSGAVNQDTMETNRNLWHEYLMSQQRG